MPINPEHGVAVERHLLKNGFGTQRLIRIHDRIDGVFYVLPDGSTIIMQTELLVKLIRVIE